MSATALGPLFPIADADTLAAKPRDLPEPWTDARWISSARAGISIALQDCGIDNGEVIWVPSYFTPAMTAPIEHVRCSVRFYPVTESLEIDMAALKRQFTLDIRGIVAPHFFGFPQQAMGELRKFCTERSIFILEDCAHGLLGKLDGRRFGEIGDYAITSLSKLFPVSEGGLLASHHGRIDATIYAPGVKTEMAAWPEAIERSSRWGRRPPSAPLLAKIGASRSDAPLTHRPTVGELIRETDDRARQEFTDAFMTAGVTRATKELVLRTDLNAMAQRRRENFAYFLDSARAWTHARPIFPTLPDGVVPYMFPLELKMPATQLAAMRAKGVPFTQWNYEHAAFHTALCPVAARYAASLVHLPVHQDLSDEESERISHTLYDILR